MSANVCQRIPCGSRRSILFVLVKLGAFEKDAASVTIFFHGSVKFLNDF